MLPKSFMPRKKCKMKSTPLTRARDEIKTLKGHKAALEVDLRQAKEDLVHIFETLEAFERLLRCSHYRTLRPKSGLGDADFGNF